MQIAYDIANLPTRENPARGNHFNVSDGDQTISYGSKILVAGNDVTMHSFVQEYAKTAVSLTDTKNNFFKRHSQVYLIPSGFNSIANFLASREPLYRQNIFQFFSGMNEAYTKLVKAKGLI